MSFEQLRQKMNEDWSLYIEFLPPAQQDYEDYEEDDYATRLVKYVREVWENSDADLDEDVVADPGGTYVLITCDILDALVPLTGWVMMNTIPLSMVLTNPDAR